MTYVEQQQIISGKFGMRRYTRSENQMVGYGATKYVRIGEKIGGEEET